MPRNGSGTMSIVNAFTPSTTISSSQVNANFSDIATEITNSLAGDGQTQPSANIPMNSKRITALASGTSRTDAANLGQVQDFGLLWAGTSSGTDTITATLTPAITAYATGQSFWFKAGGTNTGAATINFNSVGAKSIKKGVAGTTDLEAGDITVNGVYSVQYDGTNFRLSGLGGDLAAIDALVATSGVLRKTAVNTWALDAGLAHLAATTANRLIGSDGSGVPGVLTSLALTASGGYLYPTGDCSVGTLLIQNNSGAPNTRVDVSVSGGIFGTASLTVDTGTTGANGLDTGTLAATTWYYIFLIWNGTTVAALMSTSATAPTMPGGYLQKVRIGAIPTNASTQFMRVIQKGRRAFYQVVAASTTPNMPIMQNGVTGSPTVPTWTAISVSNFVPPTASAIMMAAFSIPSAGGQVFALAPNNAYGAYNSATNPPPFSTGVISGSYGSLAIPVEFDLESSNVYMASTSASQSILFCRGWIDQVNAN